MRYLLLAIVVILFYSQVQYYTSNENTLNRSLKIYKDALQNKDYKTVVDYLYPKLYIEQLTKESLYQKQKKIFEKNTITDVILTPILPIKAYSEGNYILVLYTKTITLKIKALAKDNRARNMLLFFLRDSLNEGDTFKLDKKKNIVHIVKHGTYVFLNQNNSGWKYIDVESTPKKLFKKILPIDIIDKEQVLILKQSDTMLQELFESKDKI